jgi:NAD(P)-dependent dehydrogenase (short-subunit alcohol dehydrogenase family)
MAEQSQPLSGQVAVVTGASRGIGRAIAVEFARAGADVVVSARSSESKPSKLPGTIEETAREVEAAGRRAIAVPTDVTDEAQVQAMARRTLDEFGRVDILVNNAGVAAHGTFLEMPLRRWDLVMNVNLRGALLCTKAFLPQMVDQRWGHIINISSFLARMSGAGRMPYAVSKAALEKFTQGLALELAEYSVAANAITIARSISSEGYVFMRPEADHTRWDPPEIMGPPVVWLASRDPKLFTGRVLTLAELGECMGVWMV